MTPESLHVMPAAASRDSSSTLVATRSARRPDPRFVDRILGSAVALLTLSLPACAGDPSSGPGVPTEPPPPTPAARGDLRVTVTTIGEDIDEDGYYLTLDGTPIGSVAANSTTIFSDLAPGLHTVQLEDVVYNCALDGSNPRSAEVAAGGATDVSFEVGCRFIEGALDFDVAAGVRSSDAEVVETALDLAQAYMDDHLGGGVPRRNRDTIAVRIVAKGDGVEKAGGGAACCSAFSTGGDSVVIVRPFFDVAHSDWTTRPALARWRREDHQRALAMHEYARGWQHGLGCLSSSAEPLGHWLSEGLAQYVAYRGLIEQDRLRANDVLEFMRSTAEATGELDLPLQAFEPLTARPWPGHVGYLAVDRLVAVAPDGPLAARRVCEGVAEGKSFDSSFEAAFGISLSDFYAVFDAGSPVTGGAPSGISFSGLTGLDSSNAATVKLTLGGSVVDRNGDGTAVTSAVVFVSVDPAGLGVCPGPLQSQADNGVSPSDNGAMDPVAVDVTDQVNANGGRFEVAFTARNLSDLSGLSDVTYCFEVVADDGARRKNGTDDGVAASAIVSKDFTWL